MGTNFYCKRIATEEQLNEIANLVCANKIDEAANNLIKVCNDIVKNGGKEPIIKCVICGLTNAAYRRLDGVYVIPITALKN